MKVCNTQEIRQQRTVDPTTQKQGEHCKLSQLTVLRELPGSSAERATKQSLALSLRDRAENTQRSECLKLSGKCTKEDRAAQRDDSIELQRIFSRIQQKEEIGMDMSMLNNHIKKAVQHHKPTRKTILKKNQKQQILTSDVEK